MKLKVQTHSLDRLSPADRYMVYVWAQPPHRCQTLSEWAAALAQNFETPGATELHHGWTVIHDETGVYLRHPFVLVVLSITLDPDNNAAPQ